MNIEPIVFYLFSTVLVLSAIAVVTVRNSVFAALFLVLAFFTCAALWILLEAEFLSLVLILVYVGAVMILFLFVVMMLDIKDASLQQEGFTKYLITGGLVAIVIVIEMAIVVGPENFGLDKFADPVARGADYSNTKELGMVLYTEYVYPFELAAVILLVAIIAAIALTMRRRPQTKYQDPSKQIIVRSEDRVRIVKMESQKMNE